MKAGENPFRTERLERVTLRLPDGVTWTGLLNRLRELKYRAAIVGPHGSGKTTFLEHLAPFLSAEGFRLRQARLDEGTRTFCAQFAAAGVIATGLAFVSVAMVWWSQITERNN